MQGWGVESLFRGGVVLILALTDFEEDPAGQNVYVSLTASVDAHPFSGTSDCVVLERDLLAFLRSAESLGQTCTGAAELRGGWGDSEYVQFTLGPRGSLGHLALRFMLREHQPDTDFRVQGTLHVEPQQLLDFASSVRQAVASRECTRCDLGR